ncbi:protein kinase C theta type-like [Eleutherodactylus coqui]|uniref:protein kinase C theta type-like n=1 Tax=Eleutherodactylus coqui TaxID=57060 RepID=UPI003461A243
MASNGQRGDGEKRKREEQSVSGLTEIKRKRSGEDEEPRPGSSQDLVPSDHSFDISRFTGLQILGRGSFSKRERRILLTAQDCPFICHLYAAQQSDDRAYFITEYLSGGSLAATIKMCGCLDISHVRFYTAEIACGLQFLHRRSIVHRDIKPNNIMLDRSGHIRLIDLGLAQDGVTSSNKISGVTGTFQFMAPEVLLGKEYDAAVDWWSLGIVVSWMAAGQSPFYHGPIRRKVIKAITRKEPKFPSWLDADLKHLLERLLHWADLELKRSRPPFKPFRRVLENRDLQWPEDGPPFHPMDGFSFTSPSWTRMTRRIRW